MKRVTLFFLACMMMLSGLNIKIHAHQEFQVHIAVLCKDLSKGQEFINKLCQRKSKRIAGYPTVCEFIDEINTETSSTAIYDPTEQPDNYDIYHVKFHLLREVNRSLLRKCSGAIILYDISDPTLNDIVNSKTFSHSDIKALTSVETPLVKYIDSSMFSFFLGFGRGWWGALSFSSYGKERLDAEVYKNRRGQINRFTCEAEGYYKKSDNQWNRGHADISTDQAIKFTLYWICQQAERSIKSGYVGGKYQQRLDKHTDTMVSSDTLDDFEIVTDEKIDMEPEFEVVEAQKKTV